MKMLRICDRCLNFNISKILHDYAIPHFRVLSLKNSVSMLSDYVFSNLNTWSYFLAIDIGTSSARSLAFSGTGQLLYGKHISYGIQSPQPGWQEQDPEEIFLAIISSLQKVIKKLGSAPVGISFSAPMHSLIAVDETGNALTNCIIWADNRSADYARQLKATQLGKDIYRHTGTPIHPMSPLCKIAWLRDREPEIFNATHKFVGIKEYITFRLFGQWWVDYSLASATGLFDHQSLDWYAPAMNFAGITAQRLSVPVPPGFVLSGLNPTFAAALQIAPDTPWIIGASDGCLANLGALALQPGKAVVTLGTSAAMRMTCYAPAHDEQERIFNYILTENMYVAGGASNNGGIVYQWFAEQFLGIANKEKAFKSIKKIKNVPAGAAGLLFLPYLTGERAPVWDAQARGLFFGIDNRHTKRHFQRAVLEGMLFNIVQLGKALEETVQKIETIHINGGLAQMDFLMQMLADIWGKPIHTQDHEEGSAFGAFLLGIRTLGLIGNFSEASEMVHVKKTFQPDAANYAVYQQLFAIFQDLYPKLRDDFLKLDF